jgi:modulator of FtsH protease HflC
MDKNFLFRIAQAIAVIGLVLFLTPFFSFVVDQRELAVVLRFGKPVREWVQPGIYWKTPFIETVRILPSTYQFWGDSSDFVIPDLPTRDDKKIEVVPWAVWKITSPIAFVQRMRTPDNAEQRVAQFVRGAIRDVITQYELAELVRSSNRELKTAELDLIEAGSTMDPNLGDSIQSSSSSIQVGRTKIIEQIKADIQRRLAMNSSDEEGRGERGIELVDVGISRINFVSSVREKTFDRWIAERNALSALNVNEGERLRQEILNQTNSEVERIQGEGTKKANELRGEVDAEIIRKYAEAIEKTGEFFSFVRQLEMIEKAIDRDTQLILTTNSDMLGLFKNERNASNLVDPTFPIVPTVPAKEKSVPSTARTP